MTDKFVHSGRAANCPCISLEGERCPDCNHLLTAEGVQIAGGDYRVEHEEVRCSVCGKIISDEIIPREIKLQVQNAAQKANAKF